MNILITGGATIEYIDKIRFITNISTGKTASQIADLFSKKHKVTYLCSINSKYLPTKNQNIKIINFSDFKSLNSSIKKELSFKNYDLIIHLAAVSDFSPFEIKFSNKTYQTPLNQKISSKNNTFIITFKRNFKIIDRLKKYSKNKKIKVIGFKLTSNANKKEVRKKIKNIPADIIVHNDTSTIKGLKHTFSIYKNMKIIHIANNSKELAKVLLKINKDFKKEDL